ncbi:MAG: hypothetical protein H0V03_11750 [Thermoleophilaceae bacterium]|nr:hypothetical protein [Thermoleophilaceae bacterium]
MLVSIIAVAALAAAYTAMVPLTIACLAMDLALGLGTGAVFKLVPGGEQPSPARLFWCR